jgi:hypothetical protein
MEYVKIETKEVAQKRLNIVLSTLKMPFRIGFGMGQSISVFNSQFSSL